jgi:hypothetical protein
MHMKAQVKKLVTFAFGLFQNSLGLLLIFAQKARNTITK